MEYLKIWTDFREVMEPLNDAEKGRLFDAMLRYAADGEEPGLSGNERYIWAFARQSIDRTRSESDRLRINGMKGGRPKKEEERKGEVRKEEPRKRFVAPTVDEVRAYCKQRGNNVDAEQFVAFYASKGWKVGDQPMKNWQQAVITWEKRNKTGGKTVVAQQYSQRSYTDEPSFDSIIEGLRA